jgi:hypothetical protein
MPRVLVVGDVKDKEALEALEEKVARIVASKGAFDAMFAVGDVCGSHAEVFGALRMGRAG